MLQRIGKPGFAALPGLQFPVERDGRRSKKFVYLRGLKQQELGRLTVKTQNAAITFYIIAGLLLLTGLVDFFRYADSDDSVLALAIFGGLTVVYIILGSWSMKKPVAAITTGLLLYVTLIVLEALGNSAALYKGLLVKAIVVGVLIRALINALNAEKIKKGHKI